MVEYKKKTNTEEEKMATDLYRRIIVLEVLSDVDPSSAGIEDIAYQISEGDWSGAILSDTTTVVDAGTMRQLLINQGSDPTFLVPEDDGSEI